VKFVKCSSLGVRSRNSRYKSHVKLGFRIPLYKAGTGDGESGLLNETIETNEARVPKAAARLEAGFEDVIAVMACLSGTGSASGRLMAWSGSTRRFACRFDKNLQKMPLVF
jgi:hypothetical protein